MLEELTSIATSPIAWQNALVHIGLSLVAATAAYLLYQVFYGSKHIGAGVHRTFLIGGPAITMIFLVIQTSIPLGLGMLGALSFVRFRTPVKDPAEIGFLLLLIASSIGVATSNYLITALLFVFVFIALGAQWLGRNRLAVFGRGHLMISMDQTYFPGLEKKLTRFLSERLSGLNLETMSTMDNRVSLHYQYRRKSNFDWTAFNNELNLLTGPAKVEVFVG
jgi:hypothetical protein